MLFTKAIEKAAESRFQCVILNTEKYDLRVLVKDSGKLAVTKIWKDPRALSSYKGIEIDDMNNRSWSIYRSTLDRRICLNILYSIEKLEELYPKNEPELERLRLPGYHEQKVRELWDIINNHFNRWHPNSIIYHRKVDQFSDEDYKVLRDFFLEAEETTEAIISKRLHRKTKEIEEMKF